MTSPDRINNTFTALLCHSTIISENWTSRRVTNTGCTVHDSYVRNLYSQTCILEMLAEQRFKYLSTAHAYCALRILLSFNKSILCIGYLGLRDPEISRFFPDYVKLVISLMSKGRGKLCSNSGALLRHLFLDACFTRDYLQSKD